MIEYGECIDCKHHSTITMSDRKIYWICICVDSEHCREDTDIFYGCHSWCSCDD